LTGKKYCPYGGKLIYRTKKKAIKAADRIRPFIEHMGRTPARREYKCPNCGFWHLTKQEMKTDV
jgi:predicted RNA-binding Zn-ribbon protein involved in translation (DUF1610 family)